MEYRTGGCHTGPSTRVKSMMALPHETVEISVQARDLPDLDLTSKSDPKCILKMRIAGEDKWVEKDQTECLRNNLNPDFEHKFIQELYYEVEQEIKLEFVDVDSDVMDSSKQHHEKMGHVLTTMRELVSHVVLEKPLICDSNIKKSRTTPKIRLVCEKLDSGVKGDVSMNFTANISGGGLFEKCKPVLELHKESIEDSFTLVARRFPVKKTMEWSTISVPMSRLCNTNHNRVLKIAVYRSEELTSSKSIAEYKTTLPELQEKLRKRENLIETQKDPKWQCTLSVASLTVTTKKSLMDYLSAGARMKIYVGIDFNRSNGSLNDEASYHYCNMDDPEKVKNRYVRAFELVLPMLLDYLPRSQRYLSAFGFGAKTEAGGSTDLFALSGDMHKLKLNNMTGIKDAYYSTLTKVKPWAPTNYTPLLEHVCSEKASDVFTYKVLLIFGVGCIDDMFKLKENLLQNEEEPLNVIICGLGDKKDFLALPSMEHHGKTLSRSMVQSVQLNAEDLGSGTVNERIIIHEMQGWLEDQFSDYCGQHNIPLPGGAPKRHPSLLV